MTIDDISPDARWQRLADAELCDEPLTADERHFLRSHVAADPAVRAEQQLRRALGEHGREDAVDPAADERTLAAVIDAFLAPPTKISSPRPRLWLGVGVLLAAGLALVWVLRPPAAPSPTPLTLLTDAPLASPSPVPGDSLARADELRTADAPACVGAPGRVRACLGPRSHARLADDGALELLAGEIDVDVAPTDEFAVTQFVLQVAGVRLTSADGSFAVRVTSHGWSAAAERGSVQLADAAGPLARLGPGDRLSRGAEPPPPAPQPPVPEDSPDPAAPVAPVAADAPAAPTPTPPVPKDTPEASARPIAPAAEMLAAVRELRREGRVREAVRAYQRLIAGHPDSPLARTAQLALGQLYLGAAHDPGAALKAFDAYLARGGPLAEEAAYGRISALIQLRRDRDARSATEQFLARYPTSSYADDLRRHAAP